MMVRIASGRVLGRMAKKHYETTAYEVFLDEKIGVVSLARIVNYWNSLPATAAAHADSKTLVL